MDYIKYINYQRHLDWDTFLAWTKKNNYRIILLTTKSSKKYTEYSYKKNDILLFGRESAGVPEFVHEKVDEKLTIPMINGVRSINVSSSVAMIVGEACRQLELF